MNHLINLLLAYPFWMFVGLLIGAVSTFLILPKRLFSQQTLFTMIVSGAFALATSAAMAQDNPGRITILGYQIALSVSAALSPFLWLLLVQTLLPGRTLK